MELNILLLACVSSLVLVVALAIVFIGWSLNIPIFSIVFDKIRLLYAIAYLWILKLFGRIKLIRLFFVKAKLNGETTLLDSISESDLAPHSLKVLKSYPQKQSKDTTKKEKKTNKRGHSSN
jgi:uncharacterized membrane protein YcjF (UPF0283 family)